ncbi:hypothetical protein OF83DRAFT_1088242 [Amylostereum chailletii]|nr:hypothetical protein OF83DRAFT_1088242 [Amylostereum chailletii]
MIVRDDVYVESMIYSTTNQDQTGIYSPPNPAQHRLFALASPWALTTKKGRNVHSRNESVTIDVVWAPYDTPSDRDCGWKIPFSSLYTPPSFYPQPKLLSRAPFPIPNLPSPLFHPPPVSHTRCSLHPSALTRFEQPKAIGRIALAADVPEEGAEHIYVGKLDDLNDEVPTVIAPAVTAKFTKATIVQQLLEVRSKAKATGWQMLGDLQRSCFTRLAAHASNGMVEHIRQAHRKNGATDVRRYEVCKLTCTTEDYDFAKVRREVASSLSSELHPSSMESYPKLRLE